MGENDEALAIWKKAVAMEPENAKAQNGLGISLYVHGDVEEGFEHLRHALRINPLSAESHYVLGKVHAGQGARTGGDAGVEQGGGDQSRTLNRRRRR